MSSFHERQKSLFNQLKEAEEQCSFSKTNKVTTPQDYDCIDRQTYRKLKHEMKQFRGRESIFKRPEANLLECLRAKRIPGHIRNPQKWVYYSLADVTPDQMSDATNAATAHALIRELEDKESSKSEMEQNSDDVFKKPTFYISSAMKRTPVTDEKAIFKSSKLIMPEYVVGITKKKEKKINLRKCIIDPAGAETKIELKLDHLYEENE